MAKKEDIEEKEEIESAEDSDAKEEESSKEEEELVWKEKEEGEGESVKGEENDEEKEEEELEKDKTSDSVRMEESEEEEEEESEEDEEEQPTHEDIKKSDILRRDLNQFVRDNQPSYNLNPQNRGSSKRLITLILFILAIVVIGGGIYFIAGLGGSKKESTPTPTPSVSAEPTPTPQALNRDEWFLEVLNGSGVTGAAKKLADQLKELGYPVVKVGNADRDDYTSHQFFVKKELEDSVDLVILDIKDIIKIASLSGELTDSTASARIIIGK